MTADDVPDCMTVEQAAAKLACSKWKVYRLIESGELPCSKWGGLYRIVPADLAAFIASHKAGGRPTRAAPKPARRARGEVVPEYV